MMTTKTRQKEGERSLDPVGRVSEAYAAISYAPPSQVGRWGITGDLNRAII